MQLPVELRRDHHWVLVATAHPAKFSETVEPLIGSDVAIPPALAALLSLPRHVTEIDAQFDTLKKYLLEYPRAALPRSESFLYWQNARFGLKPTIRINHVMIAEEPTHVVAVSKMLYASHYFWTAIELRVLVPDPARGQGVWFVTVNRSRSDGLSGFVGSIIRG